MSWDNFTYSLMMWHQYYFDGLSSFIYVHTHGEVRICKFAKWITQQFYGQCGKTSGQARWSQPSAPASGEKQDSFVE
jgi:hypothetical protein